MSVSVSGDMAPAESESITHTDAAIPKKEKGKRDGADRNNK